jgi:hypothetical protein
VNKTGKIIRIVAIIMLGFTAAMNLLGGIGTTCVAFSNNVGYRLAFKEIMDYRWLYQLFVVVTIIIGLVGIWGMVKLIRGGRTVYRNALIILVVGSIFGGVHYFTSMTLRGEAAPANVKFFLNLLTLVIFLALTIPAISKKIDFTSPGGKSEMRTGVGMAAIVAGLATSTVFMWAGPSHTFFNENWTYVFYVPLMIIGLGLITGGIIILVKTIAEITTQPVGTMELIASHGQG